MSPPDEDPRPPALICVLCEIADMAPEGDPLKNHTPADHHEGVIPLTSCHPCFRGNHAGCVPIAPYFCCCQAAACQPR